MADQALSFGLDDPAAAGVPAATAGDWALADSLREGDEAAYEELIQRFEQPVYSIVSRLVDDPGDAPDIVQEVFLKIFRYIPGFRGESSLKTWIYRIAVNEARNHHRWFGRHRGKEVGLEPVSDESLSLGERLADPARDPFEMTLNQEMRELIEAGLKNLSPSQRAVLVLREIEGLSYEEIAAILEISLGTVKSRILRGREALRQQIEQLLDPAEGHGEGLEWGLPFGTRRGSTV